MCIFFSCIAVSLYGPLQRAAVRACYVPGCPVHLYFDFVILLGFERNKWRGAEVGGKMGERRGGGCIMVVVTRIALQHL